MADNPAPLCGLLNLDKPSGPTSHDMVARVRRRLKVKRVGHAGTLDPMATGVLVVGVGPATRLMSFVGDGSKEYAARLLLGRSTDSQDTTGQVLSERSAARIRQTDLETAVRRFEGEIWQIPPMVSAVHYQGRRLYELAREGKTVEREPRRVSVYAIEVLEFDAGDRAEASLRVRCSGGVYVRTLCADIGDLLGCGGCMSALRRTAVGPFRAEEAISPAVFEERGSECLLPPTAAVAHLEVRVLSEPEERLVRNGGRVTGGPVSSSPVRLEAANGQLVAIAHKMEGDWYQPSVVLGSGEQGP